MENEAKAKPIKLTYGDKTYVLMYTKGSIRQMESDGFVYSEMETKPVTMIPKFIRGAFLAKAPFTSEDTAMEIFRAVPNKPDFMVRLSSLYAETVSYLYESSAESEGNVNWE